MILTVADSTRNTFINCSSLGLPSLAGSKDLAGDGILGLLQYATALHSKSERHVGSISWEDKKKKSFLKISYLKF